MLELNEKDILDLKNYVDNIPTKYGMPILVFLDNKKRDMIEAKKIKDAEKTSKK